MQKQPHPRLIAAGKRMEERRLRQGKTARPPYFPHAHFEAAKIKEA